MPKKKIGNHKEVTVASLQKLLSLKIQKEQVKLYRTALTHRSYLNEPGSDMQTHNERLEFLGDAVLELIVTTHLYSDFPMADEGTLTSYRSSLVKKEAIARVTANLGVGVYLRMSKGEEKTGGRQKDYILANTYEAIIGAIYQDRGYEDAKAFVERTLLAELPEIIEKKLYIEPKSYLQEKAQEIALVTPEYKVVSEIGPDHEKTFTVAVYFGKKEIAKGEGSNKQAAQQASAREALEVLKW